MAAVVALSHFSWYVGTGHHLAAPQKPELLLDVCAAHFQRDPCAGPAASRPSVSPGYSVVPRPMQDCRQKERWNPETVMMRWSMTGKIGFQLNEPGVTTHEHPPDLDDWFKCSRPSNGDVIDREAVAGPILAPREHFGRTYLDYTVAPTVRVGFRLMPG